MKRITKRQSRRNVAKRRRKVARRHDKAGHWSPQPQPMFHRGTVHYEVGAHTDVMGCGGISAMHRLVTKLGLPQRIDADLIPDSTRSPRGPGADRLEHAYLRTRRPRQRVRRTAGL